MARVHIDENLLTIIGQTNLFGKNEYYFDTQLTGFLVERRPSGGITFYFRYRDADKRTRLYRIGRSTEITLQQARFKAYEVMAVLRDGGDPKRGAYRLAAAPTLADFVEEHYTPYVTSRKRQPNVDLGILRKHILPTFGAKRLTKITPADVHSFQHDLLRKGYAPATINRLLVLLSHIFNVAMRIQITPPNTNPCKGIAMFKETNRERYLSPEELSRLFKELERNRNALVCQFVRLLLYTGARKRELLDARWTEVDFDQHVLWVPPERSKSKRPRPIALSGDAISLIQAIPRKEGVPYLFFNPRTGKPPVSIFIAWDSIRRGANLQNFRLHDLRHSFASILINAGRSLYDVQRLLGHHDPKVTMRYAHLSQQTMVEASEAAASVIDRLRRQS